MQEILEALQEKHYTVAEISTKWGISTDSIIRLFENVPGVLIIRGPERKGRKRQPRRLMRIPATVADAVYREISGIREEPAPSPLHALPESSNGGGSMKNELQAVLRLAQTSSLGEIPALLGELEQIRVTALARLSAPALVSQPEKLLDARETAERMHTSVDYVYRNAGRLPFAKRLGRKLLFSSSGLDKYLARK